MAMNVTKTILKTLFYWALIALLTSNILAFAIQLFATEESTVLPIWSDPELYLSLFIVGLFVTFVFETVTILLAMLLGYKTKEKDLPCILVYPKKKPDWVYVDAYYINNNGDCFMKRPVTFLIRLPKDKVWAEMDNPFRYIRKEIGPKLVPQIRKGMAVSGFSPKDTNNGWISISNISKVT